MATSPSDLKLVQSSLNNVDEFGKLIERYEGKLFKYIRRLSNLSSEEAEEILQEAFVKAWINLNAFDQSLSFSSWIYRIVHNETISYHRKHKSRGLDKKVSIDQDLFEIKDESKDLLEEAADRAEAEKIHTTLTLLPEKYRDVLILRYFEDKSYEEISDILKKPMGTIATLLNRAKSSFKKAYNP